MIILDTNVVSELMRPAPNPNVITWNSAQPTTSLCTTAICLAELWTGAAILSPGQRRDTIAAQLRQIATAFEDRILAFDQNCALPFSQIVAKRRASGKPISMADGQIASIARVYSATVATRDVDGFSDCGVNIINPWTESP
ncbi:MAG: type II toxin-antitoxin system VapC family toxin [Sphingomonadales bacterium]